MHLGYSLMNENFLVLCSIFAHIINVASTSLWKCTTSSLLDTEWILGGDINMVEFDGDWCGGFVSVMCGIEK